MKILITNKFFYPKGGAERWMFNVDRLLNDRGHETVHLSIRDPQNLESPWNEYFISPVDYNKPLLHFESIRSFFRLFHSSELKKSINRLVAETRPDVVLVNNVYHQLGATLIREISRHRVPMIMMLHDYKIVCPSYNLLRNGRECDKCSDGQFFWSAVHGCGGSYHRGISLALETYWQHHIYKNYHRIDAYMAPSRYLIDKFKAMGFDREIYLLENFVEIPDGVIDPATNRIIGYAGRLSYEKGLHVLLEAAGKVPDVEIRIAGTGPEYDRVKREAPPNVAILGRLDYNELMAEMSTWRAAVLPSIYPENCPFGILEAFALGLPVIGSNIGGMTELLQDRGILFPAGNAKALAESITGLTDGPETVKRMSKRGRDYVQKYCTPDRFMDKFAALLATVTGREDIRPITKIC